MKTRIRAAMLAVAMTLGVSAPAAMAEIPEDAVLVAQAEIDAGAPAGDAGVPAETPVDPETAPDEAVDKVEADPLGFVKDLYDAAKGGQWIMLFGLALVGLVWLARKFAVRLVPWFGTGRGGLAFTALLVVMATGGLALAGGMPLDSTLLSLMLEAIATAIGIYVAGKKVAAPS